MFCLSVQSPVKNPVTSIHLFLPRASKSLDSLFAGLSMMIFDCLIPHAAALILECFSFNHSLNVSNQQKGGCKYWFGNKESPTELLSHDICILITLNYTMTRSQGECNLVLTRQATHCLLSPKEILCCTLLDNHHKLLKIHCGSQINSCNTKFEF